MEVLLLQTLIKSIPGVAGAVVAGIVVWLTIRPAMVGLTITLKAMQDELIELKVARINCQTERKHVESDLHSRITAVSDRASELKGRMNGAASHAG